MSFQRQSVGPGRYPLLLNGQQAEASTDLFSFELDKYLFRRGNRFFTYFRFDRWPEKDGLVARGPEATQAMRCSFLLLDAMMSRSIRLRVCTSALCKSLIKPDSLVP